MFRKPYSLSKQLIVATALVLGASSVALADDSSMNPLVGDSYKYFNGGYNFGQPGQFNRSVVSNAPVDPSWRQSHPNGLTERELQALSASDLSASVAQVNPPVLASAPADPMLRQSRSESDLEALSSSTLARWQPPKGSGNLASAAPAPAYVAQAPSKEKMSAQSARY